MNNIYKPIIFSGDMVNSILAGRKTQTRRIVNPQPREGVIVRCDDIKRGFWCSKIQLSEVPTRYEITERFRPNYQIGDILWVRETYARVASTAFGSNFIYKADFDRTFTGWKPSIHMPKEAARIFLKVLRVRCERLRDIFHRDAIEEGIEPLRNSFKNYLTKGDACNELYSFMTLWTKIYGGDSWSSNPFVWVYEFEQIKKPTEWLQKNTEKN